MQKILVTFICITFFMLPDVSHAHLVQKEQVHPMEVIFFEEVIKLNPEMQERIWREISRFGNPVYAEVARRTGKYFPFIEQRLKEAGLHDDIKYLAIVESELNISARSGVNAGGMWQFMKPTARKMKLKITKCVDERYDYQKATDAAITYLTSLHDQFKNWPLVFAAYNMGETKVAKMIKKQKKNDYWKLHLNSQTARFVPRIIAAKIVFSNPRYFFGISKRKFYSPQTITQKQITVPKEGILLSDIAHQYKISPYTFRQLNLHLRCSKLLKGIHYIYLPTKTR